MSAPKNEQLSRREDLQTIQAANLSVVNELNASPEVKRLYQQFRDNFGRPQVPGILQCFATHPPLLEHMMGLAKNMLFTEGALGRQNKELISAFVSAKNGCAYCSDSHAYSFRMYGGHADATKAVLACAIDAQAITPQQRSLLQFAEKITNKSCSIGPEDIEDMRVAGWNDLQIAEAIHVTALFASFNRVVNSFGLPSQELMRMFEKERVDVESR